MGRKKNRTNCKEYYEYIPENTGKLFLPKDLKTNEDEEQKSINQQNNDVVISAEIDEQKIIKLLSAKKTQYCVKLMFNGLDSLNIFNILDNIQTSFVVNLDLSFNKIESQGALKLFKQLRFFPYLERLNISNNKIDFDEVFLGLKGEKLNKKLSSLNLSGNAITSIGLNDLRELLQKNTLYLSEIDLSSMKLAKKSLEAVHFLLRGQPELKRLEIEGNPHLTLQSIAKAFIENFSIICIEPQACRLFEKIIARNKEIRADIKELKDFFVTKNKKCLKIDTLKYEDPEVLISKNDNAEIVRQKVKIANFILSSLLSLSESDQEQTWHMNKLYTIPTMDGDIIEFIFGINIIGIIQRALVEKFREIDIAEEKWKTAASKQLKKTKEIKLLLYLDKHISKEYPALLMNKIEDLEDAIYDLGIINLLQDDFLISGLELWDKEEFISTLGQINKGKYFLGFNEIECTVIENLYFRSQFLDKEKSFSPILSALVYEDYNNSLMEGGLGGDVKLEDFSL